MLKGNGFITFCALSEAKGMVIKMKKILTKSLVFAVVILVALWLLPAGFIFAEEPAPESRMDIYPGVDRYDHAEETWFNLLAWNSGGKSWAFVLVDDANLGVPLPCSASGVIGTFETDWNHGFGCELMAGNYTATFTAGDLTIVESFTVHKEQGVHLWVSAGQPGEDTHFYLDGFNLLNESWAFVLVDDANPGTPLACSASGTVDSVDAWGSWHHDISCMLNAGDYTATLTVGELAPEVWRFKVYEYETWWHVSPGYAGEPTTVTIGATNSDGMEGQIGIWEYPWGPGSGPIYEDDFTIDSNDWRHSFNITLSKGWHYLSFGFGGQWAGGDFYIAERDDPEPPPPPPSAPPPEVRGPRPTPIDKLSIGRYEETTTGFVTMLYNRILSRAPESEGLNAWVGWLGDGDTTGADIVYRFIFGEEAQARIAEYSNEEFVTFLYRALFNREPEEEGFNAWISRMTDGMTREEVVERFTRSEEFVNLCNMFGITPYAGYTEDNK